MLSSQEVFEIKVGALAVQEKLTLTRIMEIVCKGLDMLQSEIKVKKRDRHLVFARHLFMYLARKYTKYSLMDIGRYLDKDHATVVHANKAIMNMIETEPKTRKIIEYHEKEVQKCISMAEWIKYNNPANPFK